MMANVSFAKADVLTCSGNNFDFSTNNTASLMEYSSSDHFALTISGISIAANEVINLSGLQSLTASIGGFSFNSSNSQLSGSIDLGAAGQVSSWSLIVGTVANPVNVLVVSCGVAPCRHRWDI